MLLVLLDNFFFLKEGKSFKRPRTLENKVKGEGSIVSELPWDSLMGLKRNLLKLSISQDTDIYSYLERQAYRRKCELILIHTKYV